MILTESELNCGYNEAAVKVVFAETDTHRMSRRTERHIEAQPFSIKSISVV